MDVVCGCEEKRLDGDFYIPDDIQASLTQYFVSKLVYSEPSLCWQCKENPHRYCARCHDWGLK